MVSLVKCQFNKNDSNSTPYNEIELLVRDSCTFIIPQHYFIDLAYEMGYNSEHKIVFLKEIHEKLIHH